MAIKLFFLALLIVNYRLLFLLYDRGWFRAREYAQKRNVEREESRGVGSSSEFIILLPRAG